MGFLDKLFGKEKIVSKKNDSSKEKEHSEDIYGLLSEIIYSESSFIIGDTSQDKRIEKLVKMGEGAINPTKQAIIQVIPSASNMGQFENMGLLCEAIGKIGGEDAFGSLKYFAALDSNIFEYKFIRIGAIKGLSTLNNENVFDFFSYIKNNPEDPQNEMITKMDPQIMEIIEETLKK